MDVPLLEVAHRMVFGYGYVTWEWTRGLRGFTHPLIFAAVYKVAAMLGLDSVPVLVWSPRVVQALIAARNWNGERGLGTRGVFFCFCFCFFSPHISSSNVLSSTQQTLFANVTPRRRVMPREELSSSSLYVKATGDVYTYRLAWRWFDGSRAAARWALFCSLSCWFNFFCGVRTFSNCTEAVLTTAALSYWPWRRRTGEGQAEGGDGVSRHARAAGAPAPGGGGGGGGGGGRTPERRPGRRSPSLAPPTTPPPPPPPTTLEAGTNRFLALSLAAAACVIRPTAALYWLPLALVEMRRTPGGREDAVRFVLREAVPVVRPGQRV